MIKSNVGVFQDQEEMVRIVSSSDANTRGELVAKVADFLFNIYCMNYGDSWYIDEVNLCGLLNIRIDPVSELDNKARLIPTQGGFCIIIDDKLMPREAKDKPRYRSLIAHELAHTFFYSYNNNNFPKRLIPYMGKKEESFCYDVGRNILASKGVLEKNGFFLLPSIEDKCNLLKRKLYISNDYISRVVLHDHQLVQGLAARWIRNNGTWILRNGNGNTCVSRGMSKSDKENLRNIVKEYLNGRFRNFISGYKIVDLTGGRYFYDSAERFILIYKVKESTEFMFEI